MLSMKEDDISKLLAASVHLGDPNVDFQMAQYIFKVRADGVPIINLRKTWEKLLIAARVVAAIENPTDVCVLSNKPFGQRAILKFAHYTGAHPIAGRFTPGTFTNQIQKAFREPRLLIVTDPRSDHQPITEASYVNIPVIAFCNTSSPMKYIDIAIPCNNLGKTSLGLMWWLLCREVMRLRGTISRDLPWEIMPDLFFYRDPEEIEKEEKAKMEEEQPWPSSTIPEPAEVPQQDQWVDTTGPQADWGAEVVATGGGGPTPQVGGGLGTAPPAQPVAAPPPTGLGDQDWNVGPTTATKDWADDGDWGNTEPVGGGNW